MGQGTAFDAEAGATTTHVWFLPSEPASSGLLRRDLRALLASLPPAQLDDVVLTACEVLANAVLHGEGPITVRVRGGSHGVRVEVTDHGGGSPQLTRSTDLLDGGRGLLIVDDIATRWGVLPLEPGPGKTVWFQIDVAPDTTR